MKNNNYDTNLLNLQLSIENNMSKWEMMPLSNSNHMYESAPEKEDFDNVITFEDPEEYEEIDLDVPVSELDNQQESVGAED